MIELQRWLKKDKLSDIHLCACDRQSYLQLEQKIAGYRIKVASFGTREADRCRQVVVKQISDKKIVKIIEASAVTELPAGAYYWQSATPQPALKYVLVGDNQPS